MSQHSCIQNSYQMLYMQANSGQHSVHLPTLDLCPCYPYLKLLGNFQLEH
uniref:Uncharacterized protein n=1 Tax=Rhizophora mucronata TaxID=61149 RepID=A0A2P2JAR3_RHIMU